MKQGISRIAGTLLLLLLCTVAQAGTVTYVYSDPQGTPLAEADAQGNIIATFDYRPYGTQALGQPSSGPGYTGHVNDPDTGFVYMQARYYDPEVGRFLSNDPATSAVAAVFGFNRYSYANDNPIANVDPDGKECVRQGKEVRCDPHVDGLPPVTFPAPKGWPKTIKPGDENYHRYNKALAGKQGSGNAAKQISRAIADNATPGGTAASTEGSANNASPRAGALGDIGRLKDSPVITYLRQDANGNTIVVNVTVPGHPLFPGYVERAVTTVTVNGHDYAIINNAGEGAGMLQGKYSPVANWIDSVWIQNSQQIFDSVGQ